LNKADLARDVGIAPSTANQWLSVLEVSGQVVLLEPWFSNRTKSIVKSPKLYIADTGLLCALLNIRSEEALRQSPTAGAVWETFVFAQLRDRERRAGRTGSLFFWRDRTREVDFVVDAGGRLELFEANMDGTSRPRRHGQSGLCTERNRQVTRDRRRSRLAHTEQFSIPERLSRVTCNRAGIDRVRLETGIAFLLEQISRKDALSAEVHPRL
jgi:predicted AAA+ superfamily ATPase